MGYAKDLFVCSLKSEFVEWASLLDFSSRRTIWPYQPAFYVNLCTVDHDNSSCTYRDRDTGMRIPRPVMACRSSWYLRDTSVGSVIGYRAKDDVRSGLFVELLHGDRCYNSRTSKWIVHAKLRQLDFGTSMFLSHTLNNKASQSLEIRTWVVRPW